MKKSLTVNELFCGMPNLKAYFKEMDKTIKSFSPKTETCTEIEKLKKKRRNLLQTAKAIDRTDLQILYYLHNLQKIRPYQLLLTLQKVFLAEEELRDFINQKPTN